MSENGSEGFLVRVKPLGPVRWLCQRLVEEMHEADATLLLVADPVWAAANDTVLVNKGFGRAH